MSKCRGLALVIVLAVSGCAGGGDGAQPSEESGPSEGPLAPEDQVARDLGVEGLGDVAVIREVTPDEAGAAHAACMTEAGWSAEVDDYGAVDYSFSREQEDSFNQSYARCHQQYPIAKKYTVPLGDEQHGLIYDHLVQSAIPCLEGLGYDVETPPSRGVYLDTVTTPEAYLVNEAIYDAVIEDTAAGRWDDPEEVFQRVCPIMPPDEALYGG